MIVALPAEARSLGIRDTRPGACVRWREGWAAVSGIGPYNAMRAAERLLACGVTRLENWGVAGALDAGLASGDLLVPDRILYAHGDPGFEIDRNAGARLAAAFDESLRVRRGALWSVQQPLASEADKRSLAARSGALAVDMEAAPIAAVAARARLPFVAVKAICDPVTREVPGRIARTLGDRGVSMRMVAAIALGGPATWRATHALTRDFARARRTLAAAARLSAA
ncbi:MAG: hypothetical protein OJF55_000675 [Rhodanobacteraceae bacterium]|nr:MAG: hypothetical protein OJF55_000675 [Rhodanobacteraceae bacterium]